MRPYCSRCGTTHPSPIRDDEGDLVYWFQIEEDGEGGPIYGSDDDDYPTITGITERDFDYDGSCQVVCPSCAIEQCDFITGDIVEDGLDEDGWLNEEFDPFEGAGLMDPDFDDPLDFDNDEI